MYACLHECIGTFTQPHAYTDCFQKRLFKNDGCNFSIFLWNFIGSVLCWLVVKLLRGYLNNLKDTGGVVLLYFVVVNKLHETPKPTIN